MKLSEEQIEQYRREGYLVVPGVLTDDDLAPVIAEIDEFVDRRAAELKEQGKITHRFEGEPFERRYAKLYSQSKEIGNGLDIFFMRGQAMFRFLHNPNLLDVVESLLGEELTCNPIQHLRAKVPQAVKGNVPDYFQNVPWHQDAAVTWEEADPTEIITFWIPLVDATVETGCMEVIPGAFKLGLLRHQAEGGTSIVPEEMPAIEPIAVPCPKGGVVIMNKYTPHRGTPNVSDIVRWSIDLRYQRTGEPTGRPFHPDFVVRSRTNPAGVLTDHSQWCALWMEALESSKGKRLHRV